jgi:hypothetical protein
MASNKRHLAVPAAEPLGQNNPRATAAADRRGTDRVMIFHGYIVMPRDRTFGQEGSEANEPDWNAGVYFQDRSSGRPVGGWIFHGPPPEFLRQAWREGRVLYGALVAREEPGQPLPGPAPPEEEPH